MIQVPSAETSILKSRLGHVSYGMLMTLNPKPLKPLKHMTYDPKP